MWDPGSYQDTDFGLDEDESFEPEGAEVWEDVDTTRPYIRTVLGPIPPDALGICLPFEYLDLPEVPDHIPGTFHLPSRDGQITEEMEAYFVSGGRSIVSLVPISTPNALARLQAIGRRVPVHIIAASAPALGTPESAELDGQTGLTVVDLDTHDPPPSTNPVLPLVIRAANAAALMSIREILEQRGHAAAATTALVRGNAIFDASLVELANAGCMVGFEGLGVESAATAAAIDSIVRLMDAGQTHCVLVSTGLENPSQYVSQGGSPGWIYLLEFFTLQLMAAGASAMDVRAVLIDNPATALSLAPHATQSPSKSV